MRFAMGNSTAKSPMKKVNWAKNCELFRCVYSSRTSASGFICVESEHVRLSFFCSGQDITKDSRMKVMEMQADEEVCCRCFHFASYL